MDNGKTINCIKQNCNLHPAANCLKKSKPSCLKKQYKTKQKSQNVSTNSPGSHPAVPRLVGSQCALYS